MSRPPTPSDRDPQNNAENRFHPVYSATEWAESYRPGGFHPVHLGETYDQRYEIFRKLGYGSYSTVWLAFDHTQGHFVAIKFMTVRTSESVTSRELSFYSTLDKAGETEGLVRLERSFELHGPNGRHSCLVFQPMGTHLSDYIRRSPHLRYGDFFESRLPFNLAKQVLREVLVGLRGLHRCGIVHGDLHQGNVLVNVAFDHLEPSERLALKQDPKRGRSLRRLDGKQDMWAPSYLIPSSPPLDYVSMDLVPFVKLSDLGSAFFNSNPPAKLITPSPLRSPELIFGLKVGFGVDLWSFGCFMFQILTGSPLFFVEALDGDPSDEEINDEHLIQISEVLSPLPSHLFQHWRRGHGYFDPNGKRLRIRKEESSMSDSDSQLKERRPVSTANVTKAENDNKDNGVRWADAPVFETLEQLIQRKVIYDLDDSQKMEAAAVIRWIMPVDAPRRPSAEEVFNHPWFHS